MTRTGMIIGAALAVTGAAHGTTEYTEKDDELGSGITRTMTTESDSGDAILLARCSDGKDANVLIYLARDTVFPNDADFDRGVMSVDMTYKFDTDGDATKTSTEWLAPLMTYNTVFTFDRSVLERIGSSSLLVVSIGKSGIRKRFVLRGTAGPVREILGACPA